jgi:hypothetical protein
MTLNEMYDKAIPGYQNVEDDNGKIKLGDLRKTKLTLKQINKLRQMNDIRAYEQNSKLNKVRKQYSPAPEQPNF